MTLKDITPRHSNSTLERREPLTFKGERVMTTAMAAEAFGAVEKQLLDNYQNNADRFAFGKHLFRVEGSALRELKNSPDFIGVVHPKTPHLYLWTERGIARHAKILETDTAWAIYEELEDTYFRVRGEREERGPELRSATKDRLLLAREARLSFNGFLKICKMIGVTGNHAVLSANGATKETTGIDMLGALGVPRLIADTDGAQITVTDIGREIGRTARQTNDLLLEHGYQTRFRDAKNHYVYEPTEKGKEAGGRMTATGKKHHNGTPVTQLVWSTATIRALKADMEEGSRAAPFSSESRDGLAALTLEGRAFLIDTNDHRPFGEAVVLTHDGSLRVEKVEPGDTFMCFSSRRYAVGPWRDAPNHGSNVRQKDGLLVLGRVLHVQEAA